MELDKERFFGKKVAIRIKNRKEFEYLKNWSRYFGIHLPTPYTCPTCYRIGYLDRSEFSDNYGHCKEIYYIQNGFGIVDFEDIIIDENKNMDKVQNLRYKALKKISGEEIMKNNPLPCEKESEKFIKHFGFRTEVKWDISNELWIEDNIVIGIEWLKENGFIEDIKNIEYIIYDENKKYFIVLSGSIYELRQIEFRRFAFVNIERNSSTVETLDKEKSAQNLIDSTFENFKIKVFNTFKEAMQYYYCPTILQ